MIEVSGATPAAFRCELFSSIFLRAKRSIRPQLGNQALTLYSNMLTNLNLTDMETCFKMFRAEVIKSIKLECDHFGFEPEITAKVSRGTWRVYEVPISYSGRDYSEGKKITWRDGFPALWTLVKYRFTD